MEKLKPEQKEALYELNKANNELKNHRKKQLIILLIFLTIFAIVRCIIVGPFNLPFNLIPQKNHIYVVAINNKIENITYKEKYINKLIPLVINLVSTKTTKGDAQGLKYRLKEEMTIIPKIYDCYKNNKQVSCSGEKNLKQKENKNFEHSIRIFTPNIINPIIYEGKDLENIEKRITMTGTYSFRITSTYKNIKIENHFVIKITV